MSGYPSQIRGRIENATLQDALHAWLFFSAFNTDTSFQLLQYSDLIYTSGFVEWYAIGLTSIQYTLQDDFTGVGAVAESEADGTLDHDHLELTCPWHLQMEDSSL